MSIHQGIAYFDSEYFIVITLSKDDDSHKISIFLFYFCNGTFFKKEFYYQQEKVWIAHVQIFI